MTTVTLEDARRAVGDLYHTKHGNRHVCPVCRNQSLTLNKGTRGAEWVAKCWHGCDQDILATAIIEMAGGVPQNATAYSVQPAPAPPPKDEEPTPLQPYTVAEYAKDKVEVPEEWLHEDFDIKDGLYKKVKAVLIPWPNGTTTQWRLGDGVKRFKAGSHPGLYVPPFHDQFVTCEQTPYCFVTEGVSNTHNLAWGGQPVVGVPSCNWQPEFAKDEAFRSCSAIYVTQDPPNPDPTKPDSGRELVQKVADSFPRDKVKVYAVKFWQADGKGGCTGCKDANELWLSTAFEGDGEPTNEVRLLAYERLLREAVANAELVQPQKPLEWGTPVSLEDLLPPVPPFRVEYLPQCLRALVQDIAERLPCPIDLVAAACVTALAGVVGGRAHAYPKENDKTWKVPLNLWGAMVADPGQKKSPIYTYLLEPMVEVQKAWAKENERARLLWDAESGDPKPKRKMVHTGDATIEALQDLMAENPQGLFYTRDELSGWLADLEKKGHESDRKFYLTAWSGATYPVNRVGRGDVYAYVLCSMFGSFQPATIKGFLNIGVEDGLFQRIQVLVWPDPMRPFRVDRAPNQAAIDTFKHVISTVAELPEYALRFDFNPEAQQVFNSWYDEHTAKIEQETYAPKIQHLTKYHSLMPILAALFQLADLVTNTAKEPTDNVFGGNAYGDTPTPEKPVIEYRQAIDVAHARQAIAFCTYLAGHLNRVYSTVPQPWEYSLAELARKLENGVLGAEFTVRDLLRKQWSGLHDRQDVERALLALEVKDWVRPAQQQAATGAGGDRRSQKWLVNPAVLEGLQ